MTEDYDPTLEAVTALRAHGHTVEAADECERWQINGGEWVSLGELLALAARLGLVGGPGLVQ
ncbi:MULTISPECIES: hypothetical protein [unclassified Methylobacterium]|uniref:hypothetical protein n=1 Tax=unclassified Methylobacterium TaxID=2615210 RepID=UPI001FBA4B41|nr:MULTISPECIES: hypothetical protein [unclassified Methylobacterium]MCJ2092088.1 hypothetical protein [Methylobacterium sp. J-072]MCJ2139514.1 hypothetical protein [Methylobacterium sp. E-066]